jgi:5'-nucleotidase
LTTPQILITNDDGISAPGLRALVSAMEGLGCISVVAPNAERSAAAQSLTLRQPIFCEQVAEREWAVEGTPADAMMLALHQLMPERPSLVISGINPGANLGENVFYSGTVGAAMEAAINRVPAFAISLAYRGTDVSFARAARFARQVAELVLSQGLPEDVLLNVNVPHDWKGEVRFTHQSKKVTRTLLEQGSDPRGRTYYWLHDQRISSQIDPGSDYAAVAAGSVSVTPLQLDRTHHISLNHLSHWKNLLRLAPGR